MIYVAHDTLTIGLPLRRLCPPWLVPMWEGGRDVIRHFESKYNEYCICLKIYLFISHESRIGF